MNTIKFYDSAEKADRKTLKMAGACCCCWGNGNETV